MNTKKCFALILALVLFGGVALGAVTWAAPGNDPLAAGAPTVVAYQGEVRVAATPYTGDGYFKFAVVNAAGNTTYWSNDGTSSGGSPPTAAVQRPVSDGLFSVLLGDTSLGGMTQALTADVFDEPDRYLRVWFSTSAGGPFDPLAPDTRIAAVPYALQAQDADTLDGNHQQVFRKRYQGVVVVAKQWGDYSTVQGAINSITDASGGKPYLVWVAPGVYVEQVTMKPHVHVQGAGQEATIIHSSASSSAWPPDQATLVLASDTSLRDLTVSNNGAGTRNVALMAAAGTARAHVADVTARAEVDGTIGYGIFLSGSGTAVTLQQVSALGENGTGINYGLYNCLSAAATLRGGFFTGRGGPEAYGIGNSHSGTTLDAEGVTALGEGATDVTDGLDNEAGAVATLRGGSFTGRGGIDARGIHNQDSGTTLDAEGVTALGEDGNARSFGLRNYQGAATLRGGSFTGRGGPRATGIHNQNSGTTLEADSVTALGEDGTANRGLENYGGAEATLRGGSFTGRGGATAMGIENINFDATLEAESTYALAEDGSSNNYGLRNYSDATAYVTQSVLEGATYSVFQGGTAVTVSNSRLVGGPVKNVVTCVLVTRGTTISTDGSTCP